MRGRELITSDEPTVVTEAPFYAVIVEDRQSGGRLANSAGTDEGDWGKAFREMNDFLDQLAASEVSPRWWGWRFP